MADVLKGLQTYFDTHHVGAFLIPTRDGGKIPMFKHKEKDGVAQYDGSKFMATGAYQCRDGCAIVMPLGLIVIDVDDKALAAEMVARFPAFGQTVTCDTKKGAHFYFTRTPDCMLMDGARQVRGISNAARVLVAPYNPLIRASMWDVGELQAILLLYILHSNHLSHA